MCGLVGFIDYEKYSSHDLILKMSNTLKHRGPDDSGIDFWVDEHVNVGLAHRRLSIQDLSAHGHQPMSYEHLTIIFNGEIYNFNEIKKELSSFGYLFNSASDTEVILKAYHKWGSESVDKFRGMFAIALFDKKKNKLILFRDRAGVKPLYYSINNKRVIFGSELKAITEYTGFDKIINKAAVSSFLKFGYILAPNSIFQGVYKLPPGHYLEYDVESKVFNINKYWDISKFYKEKFKSTDVLDAIKQLEEILIDSFNLRMISDVPVGAFLSGGVDSSLVVAILQKHFPGKLTTFSIGFDDEKYNEAPYAKKIAEYLNTNHHEYICRKEDALLIIPELPKIYDEPFADSSAIPTTLVSKLAAEHVSVVLSGDGGDELFAGYIAYTELAAKIERIQRLPFRNLTTKLLNLIPDPIFYLNYLTENKYTKYLRFKSVNAVNGKANAFKAASSVFTDCEIKTLLKTKYQSCYFPFTTDVSGIETSEQMMISDFNGYLPDDLLVKVDRATMSVSIEGREPLLDHKIAEFAAKLPFEQKKGKHILKDILSKYIPRDLFERKKQGFGIPINGWLRNELSYLLFEYFDNDKLAKQDIFDPNYIRNLLDLFMNEKNDDRKIWTLLMFQMWYEQNFDF